MMEFAKNPNKIVICFVVIKLNKTLNLYLSQSVTPNSVRNLWSLLVEILQLL